MGAINVMSRKEIKYILSPEQIAYFKEAIKPYMEVDAYGKTTILSLYYDTPDSRLIRASLEKPTFKEKIRLRSYGVPSDKSPVFLELKRKYDGIVYKRRAILPFLKPMPSSKTELPSVRMVKSQERSLTSGIIIKA